MPSAKSHIYRALLLTLLIGFTASTLHVSTHLLADQQNCEFCSGHTHPAHAIAPSSRPFDLAPAQAPEPPHYELQTYSVPRLFYRQRAPPTFA